jgi:uncharacterized protein YndB with AHSA1/START domain
MESFVHEFQTPAGAKTIYDAVGTAAGIKGWWAKSGSVTEKVGGTTELRFDKEGRVAVMKFSLDELEPNRRVRWTCTENANPVWLGTTLTWDIEDGGSQRRVRFAHEGFTRGGPPYDLTITGWKHFMKSLESYVGGGGGQPW